MAESGDVVNYRRPLGVTTDEIGDSTVRVCLVFPGIKSKRFKKNEVANGDINVQILTRSIDVKLQLQSKDNGRNKVEHFQYHVKRLPQDIVDDKSTWKVEKDKVVLMLHKAKPMSWAGDLDSRGLETDESD